MCVRDDGSASHLKPGVLLIILLCACGLAVHIVAEGLAPACGMPVLDLLALEGHAHEIHEHGEDHFIFSFLITPPIDLSVDSLLFLALSRAASTPLTPQPPPPNF